MMPVLPCMKPLSLHCAAARTNVLPLLIAVQSCDQGTIQEDYQ